MLSMGLLPGDETEEGVAFPAMLDTFGFGSTIGRMEAAVPRVKGTIEQVLDIVCNI